VHTFYGYHRIVAEISIVAGWRRLKLPATASLADLHAALSPALAELHEFEIDGRVYGEPDADDQLVGRKVEDDAGVALAHFTGSSLTYRCGTARLTVQVLPLSR
jgi:hypothetical protein